MRNVTAFKRTSINYIHMQMLVFELQPGWSLGHTIIHLQGYFQILPSNVMS